MNATKERFKTWDNTLARVEELESGAGDNTQLKAQVSALTAELGARNLEIKTLRSAVAGQQNAPPASQPPAAKSIQQMTLPELIAACDQAAAAGNHLEANRFYRAISDRKANR
jgi:hypothetical protein